MIEKKSYKVLFVLLLLVFLLSNAGGAKEKPIITVVTAASVKLPLEEIANIFQKEKNTAVQIISSSSGIIFSQITRGAPYDIFLSADDFYTKELLKEGYVKEEDIFTYTIGSLKLWTKNEKKDFAEKGIKVLLDKDIKIIAVANPNVAPYGKTSFEVMKEEGLLDKVKEKIVYGENVSHVAAFVKSFSVDSAFLPSSYEKINEGFIYDIDSRYYNNIIHEGVIINKNARTEEFRNFILSEKANEIFMKYGFKRAGV